MSIRESIKIGENIARLRKEKGLTQEQLAEKLDVTFQAVSSWERDEYKPELETFILMAKKLEVPVTWIIEGRDETFTTKEAVYDWEHMKT